MRRVVACRTLQSSQNCHVVMSRPVTKKLKQEFTTFFFLCGVLHWLPVSAGFPLGTAGSSHLPKNDESYGDSKGVLTLGTVALYCTIIPPPRWPVAQVVLGPSMLALFKNKCKEMHSCISYHRLFILCGFFGIILGVLTAVPHAVQIYQLCKSFCTHKKIFKEAADAEGGICSFTRHLQLAFINKVRTRPAINTKILKWIEECTQCLSSVLGHVWWWHGCVPCPNPPLPSGQAELHLSTTRSNHTSPMWLGVNHVTDHLVWVCPKFPLSVNECANVYAQGAL